MTQVIDAEGRVKLPPEFRPGEAVDVERIAGDELIVRRTKEFSPENVRLETLPDGRKVITGLPPIDNETVLRLLEDFP